MTDERAGTTLTRQILSLAAILLGFLLFWAGIWWLITSRCVDGQSDEMRAKMIAVSENLPFDPDSRIAHCTTDVQLSGSLPVLDGAAALFPVYSAFVDAVYPSGCVIYDADAGDFAADSPLQFRNTVRGFDALLSGDADVFFSAHPSADQMAQAEAAGIELILTPIGREAFVFLVNEQNPVDDLTVEQLRGLFTGRYRNWKQVGGADRPVHPIKRIAGSGSQAALEAFLGGEPVYSNPLGFMGGSIGYSFRWYVTDVVGSGGVKMLSVNGIFPDDASIRDGSYPLTTVFYAMVRADNDNPNVPRLIEWILSDEGQALITASGYSGIGE
ncbi:MAG: substrate-binding domain-containing protein [Clostridia bacterium]|nr:substrate-binding domain-containing protein [Clostridia bacterium]